MVSRTILKYHDNIPGNTLFTVIIGHFEIVGIVSSVLKYVNEVKEALNLHIPTGSRSIRLNNGLLHFAAILCQYLSASIAVVTGRDLSQICSEEYGKATCIFLGVLTEISMIALDLTMILGTAQGLNLIFGVDLFTCVFLTAIDAVLFPVFATLLASLITCISYDILTGKF
ncbi:hypothetical protein RHSIM_Rhsim04G0146400 [Rhododendron simsii]|uniref:Uncharacterized protein n=1 Tax=Rhododendron simsii TaxID=118357 RepID=A0A834HE91_RHOSS|nr:hypothetical protein RHSIM_Rhsim04G0146400 [Rhododendron simsii]